MKIPKYFDWQSCRPLEDSQGAPWVEWMEGDINSAPFAWHPDGFRVFLGSEDLVKFDEYIEGDPYEVAAKMNSPFQEQRKRLTLELFAEALKSISASPRVLDVGCGEGHITAAIQDAQPDAELSAFDVSLTAVKRAKEFYPHLEFEVADAYCAPYPPNYFDCIVCNNIWEHVPDPLLLLERMSRIMKPGAYLLVSTPSRYRLNNLLRAFVGRPIVFASQHHVTEYSVGQVIEQMRWGKFDIERIEGELVAPGETSANTFVKFRLIAPLLQAFISTSGSHHKLGHTVFYLAKKEKAEGPAPAPTN